ncbi:SLBB domain-containing protein [Salinivirga cyanobacteriivorans]
MYRQSKVVLFGLLLIISLGQTIGQNVNTLQNIARQMQSGQITQDEAVKRAREQGVSDQQMQQLMQSRLQSSLPKADTAMYAIPTDTVREKEIHDTTKVKEKETDEYFGYDLFRNNGERYRPLDIGAMNPDYLIGPGDEIILSLWGDTDFRNKYAVSRGGTIYIEKYGQMIVGGLTLQQLETKLEKNLSRIYSGLQPTDNHPTTFLDVSLGKLQSIQVYLVGQLEAPGTHMVSSYSTVLTALIKAGGPKVTGTLRDIQVIRNGETVRRLDLYDFIVSGKKPSDIRLQNNDVIFVPPRHSSIVLEGEVKTEKIFELLPGETLADLIKYAGGMMASAEGREVSIQRTLPFESRKKGKLFEILNPRLLIQEGNKVVVNQFPLHDKDLVSVMSLRQLKVKDSIQAGLLPYVDIRGHVYKPGRYYLDSGMLVKDLLEMAGGFQDTVFWGSTFKIRADLFRYNPSQLSQKIIPIPLAKVMNGAKEGSIVLHARDSLVVYSTEILHKTSYVSIFGEVAEPGKFELQTNMDLQDLLLQAGGFKKTAYRSKIDVFSLQSEDNRKLITAHEVKIDPELLKKEQRSGFMLNDFDVVVVRRDPNFNPHQMIKILGEVKYPGDYSILYKDETITQLLERAGGLTDEAFVAGLQFIRDDSIRVVGDYEDILEGKKKQVTLQAGDSIFIPKYPGTVRVMGNVRNPGIVQYQSDWKLKDYIEAAGNYSQEAAKRKVIVYYPGGNARRKKLLSNPHVIEGSQIFVPKKPEREPVNMTQLLTSWASIAASLATVFYIVTK